MSISPNMPCDKRYLRIPCCVPLPAAREFLHIKIPRSHAEHSIHLYTHTTTPPASSLSPCIKEQKRDQAWQARLPGLDAPALLRVSSTHLYEQEQFRSPPRP